MQKKIIIGLVSQIAGGKGTSAQYLKKECGASIYRFSTMLRDVLKRLYLETDRHNMQTISTVLRGNFGEDIMAKVIATDVEKDNNSVIAVDGIRRMADIKYLREIPGFKLISIEVDAKIRYKRLVDRNENNGDSKKSFEEFLADEKGEADAEIPKVMEKADAIIDNSDNLEKLYKQIDKLIK